MTGVLRTDIQTLPALLQARGAELADERFVRDARITWSYGEFAHRVREVAGGLRERGVGPGDVVGVVLPNGPEYLEVWWAILWLGAVFNPVNPALTTREATDILEDSGARTVVCARRPRSARSPKRRCQRCRTSSAWTVRPTTRSPRCAATAASTIPPRSAATI